MDDCRRFVVDSQKDNTLIFVQNFQADPGTHTAPHSKDTEDSFHGIKQLAKGSPTDICI